MDKFKTVVNMASMQTNLGCTLVALLTAGGEHIFSSVVFSCPCNGLNFVYGLVFLLVPALALLLLGYIVSRRTWKLLTGVWRRRTELCRCRRLAAACVVLFQISAGALVAPSSWIAVALLNGNYFECAMSGTNVSFYNKRVCGDQEPGVQCETELHRIPCRVGSSVPPAVREDVLLTLRAQSQILGWILIASIMLSNMLLSCLVRCCSPISYLQLKFWRAYAQEENSLMDSHVTKHAKELADRNLQSFFDQTPPGDLKTPSSHDWMKISSLYKFSSKKLYYSMLHQYVENYEETDNGRMKMASVKSSESADNNPAVLDFVDGGMMTI
ncbi:calcium homeostasis modulator protein 6-like [Brachyistius frenatus]|uniref:calcium homeostasis modulator protein 6-like n=1 Tax=Brachyistius frenatus TaxID=100188 RepID=UPI0037E77A5D